MKHSLLAIVGLINAFILFRVYKIVYEPLEEDPKCNADLQSDQPIFKSTELAKLLPLSNDDLPFECFFSSDYFEAKRRFRDLATKAGAHRFLSLTVPEVNHYAPGFDTAGVSYDSDTFTTDVAIFYGDTKNQLWHLSGTHGMALSAFCI